MTVPTEAAHPTGVAGSGASPTAPICVPATGEGSHLERMRARAAELVEVGTLSQGDMWSRHSEALVWRAQAFEGTPGFYPVYKSGDLYSYSVLALLMANGRIDVHQGAMDLARDPGFDYLSGAVTVDRTITRIGVPIQPRGLIRDPEVYAQRMADALVGDLQVGESANGDCTQVILCGGKDSLNLLLHKWRQPVEVYSAQPNFPYVVRFVEENGLNLPVHELVDGGEPEELADESLENCCRADLQHFRWGPHLRRIPAKHGGRVVFWKGQIADVFMAPKWRTITHRGSKLRKLLLKVWKRGSGVLPAALRAPVDRALVVPPAYRATWSRCAMMQGTHVGFLRALTDALVLSAYHGPRVQQVWSDVDLPTCAARDMRDRVGELLLGRPVRYPEANPAPPESQLRVGLHRPERLLEALAVAGLPLITPEDSP